MNINNLAWLLANMISLEKLKTEQRILQRNANEISFRMKTVESFNGWNGHYSTIDHNARNNKKTKGGK